MRKLLLTALAAALVVPAPAARAAKAKPAPDLVTSTVAASLAGPTVSVKAAVKDRGSKKAAASVATAYLSLDGRQSADDAVLGTLATPRLKPKKGTTVTGGFALPAGVTTGSYRVVVCADTGHTVRERKETNNCRASDDVLEVVVQPTGPVTVAAVAGTGGTVAASGVTGGSCAQTSCTFPGAGTGTVTFTATPAAGYRFGGWSGPTCAGYTGGVGSVAATITFTRPTTSHGCTAAFVRQVTITYAVAPLNVTLFGKVTATATAGTCTDNLITGGGSCVVDAGTGSVTLTASPLVLPFKTWSGDCTGTTNPQLLTAPAADASCTATFSV